MIPLRRPPRVGWWLRPECSRVRRCTTTVEQIYEAGKAAGLREAAAISEGDALMWYQLGWRIGHGDQGVAEGLRRIMDQIDGPDPD